jgi:hypothetical protein
VLFGASSPREHQHGDEAGGENCGLQIQCQREVGDGTEELEKVLIRLFDLARGCATALTLESCTPYKNRNNKILNPTKSLYRPSFYRGYWSKSRIRKHN